MKSTERHELKRNPFAEATLGVVETLRQNRSRVMGGLAVLGALAVVIAGVMAWRAREANQAGAALGIALATSQAQIVPIATMPGATQPPGTYPSVQARAEAAVEAFTDVVTQHPSTPAARVAAFHLASELLAAGRAAEAAEAFASVADQAGATVYGSAARLGQAEALLAVGRTDEALKIYTDMAAARDGALPTDGLLMQLGRASARAGKAAEARAAFQRVIDEFPESSFVDAARQQAAALN